MKEFHKLQPFANFPNQSSKNDSKSSLKPESVKIIENLSEWVENWSETDNESKIDQKPTINPEITPFLAFTLENDWGLEKWPQRLLYFLLNCQTKSA